MCGVVHKMNLEPIVVMFVEELMFVVIHWYTLMRR